MSSDQSHELIAAELGLVTWRMYAGMCQLWRHENCENKHLIHNISEQFVGSSQSHELIARKLGFETWRVYTAKRPVNETIYHQLYV